MEKAILERLRTSDEGTFGQLHIGDHMFYTGELPWLDNLPNISCIPEGSYLCSLTLSPRFRKLMYLVNDVPERHGVRFHAANFMGNSNIGYRSQLNGCISLGERIGVMDGQKALLVSAPAMRMFEALMNKKPFQLEVINAW